MLEEQPELNISGGFLRGVTANNAGVVSLSGGTFDPESRNRFFGGALNLFGTDFAIDGEMIEGLTLGEALTILDREVTLTCLLADGSPFEIDLQLFISAGTDVVTPRTTLTVTLVQGPCSAADVNRDGSVDVLDIVAFNSAFDAGLDFNSDGSEDFFDVIAFLREYDTGCP